MIEYQGNMWDFENRPGYVICITTNCSRKRNGYAVMGAGCAFEAVKRYPLLARTLGQHIEESGSIPRFLTDRIVAFPVKRQWWEKADFELIAASTAWLKATARNMPDSIFLLPRPGCGKGGRSWVDVFPLVRNLPDNVVVVSP